MFEIVFSIYIIVISLGMIYQSYARLYADALHYFYMIDSTDSVILVVLNNVAIKWGIPFGVIGIISSIVLMVIIHKSEELCTSAMRMQVFMTIIWTLVLFGCCL